MNTMLSEIESMPEKAMHFLDRSPVYALPYGVPYLGMGSSYFAPLAFRYMGLNIFPELASEFFNYLAPSSRLPLAALFSQSGRSSEVLWCTGLFERFIAITNDADSPLGLSPAANQVIALHAGEERYSSSKTYINTLLALFKGFGWDMRAGVEQMAGKMPGYRQLGSELADKVFERWQRGGLSGIYITGSGPNIATAMQAALILSESTKLNFHGMPLAQYDHGPKETARDSIVIQVLAKGPSYKRAGQLGQLLKAAGAEVHTVEAPASGEKESILYNIIPFNYMAYYLSTKLNIKDIFQVGGKITEVRSI